MLGRARGLRLGHLHDLGGHCKQVRFNAGQVLRRRRCYLGELDQPVLVNFVAMI